jgi:3-oxoacyl-[acyl-carrier protein] reductase
MTKRFAGRTVLITGAAGGMGHAFARRFAAEGAALILTDIVEAGVEKLASDLQAQGTQCSTRRIDLGIESDIRHFADQICAEYPQLDVLINNAGLAYGEVSSGFEKLSQEKWLRYFSINTVAPLLLAQALRPSLASSRGVILNISSMAANTPATAYGVTKAALNAMTFGMANTFAADGIRVNAIEPGMMETPASKAELTVETYARVQSMQLLKQHGTADDIAALGAFLASDDARFITCEIVNCDAGNRLRGWRY